MQFQIAERDGFQIVGIKRECPCGEGAQSSGIAQFWNEANINGTVAKLAQLNNGEIKGVLGITDNYNKEKQTIDYWIAVERHGEAPSELTSFTFPKSKWAVVEGKGSALIAMPEAWNKIFTEWLPASGYEIAELPAIEAYVDPDPYREDAINQIWLAIK